MTRIEAALAALSRGGVAVLTDESDPGTAFVVAAADSADGATWQVFLRHGRDKPTLALAAHLAGSPDLAVATGPISSAEAMRLDLVMSAVAPHGVFGRAAIREAAVDSVGLAGRSPVAILAALATPEGQVAEGGMGERPAPNEDLPWFSVQDVLEHRLARETVVERVATARFPSAYAARPLEVEAFRSLVDGVEHLALVRRPFGHDPLVRLHSECLTGDALGSLRCDCGEQLRHSLELVAADPAGGAVLYLRGHEGRGIGLANKIRAYALQDRGLDTVEANTELGFDADLRNYGPAVQMLRLLGIGRVRLLTNNLKKAEALRRYGIAVTEQVPLQVGANPHNAGYLEVKRRKLGHDLPAGRPGATDAARKKNSGARPRQGPRLS